MSRKIRKIEKHFKVFCEGDTEYHYIDEMKRQHKFAISLKPVNMKGGGYSNFLEHLSTDGNTNCLAKFIIIDGDRAINVEGEKDNLREVLEFCNSQNKSGRIPHIVVVNYPDFEYVACLHIPKYKGQNVTQYIINELHYRNLDEFKTDKGVYTVLNTRGNSTEIMLDALHKENCFVIHECKIKKNEYEMKVNMIWNWEKLGRRGSNINEFFDVITSF